MAISSFGRGGKDEPMSTSAPASSKSSTSTNLTAFIDQGSEFEGKLTFKDTVRIDGSFQGEISSENTLIVGETGTIQATIRSNSVVVSGTIVGNVIAKRQVVLHKNARVDGDLETPSIVIEEGAVFNGKISMGGAKDTSSASKGSAPLKSIPGGSPEKSQNAQSQHGPK